MTDHSGGLAGFVSALHEAEAIVRSAPHAQEDRDLAEGLDYLAGLVRVALAGAWTGDPTDPWFARPSTPRSKMGLDNPDTLYFAAEISGDAEYVVTGTRGSSADLVFQVLAGSHAGSTSPASHLAFDDRSFPIAEDGSFELRFGPPRAAAGPSYFALAPDARRLLVRQTFSDWSVERPGLLRVQRADRIGAPGRPLTMEVIEDRFRRAGATLTGYLRTFLDFVQLFYLDQPVNTMYAPKITPGGLTNQYSAAGHYDLADDQVLVVTVPASGMPYQGFQLGTPWYVSLDYINHQTSLTADQARIDPDGMIRLVVGRRDPGLTNWLETTGHRRGYLQVRWQRVTRPLGPEDGPTTEVMAYDDLAGRLPFYADQRIEPGAWARRIADRQAAIGDRMLT
ncbi:hypothetical protein D0Z08_23040 [Nocardioides immobilis]|uniref:DUF1214 domain-containing protein n=1 Tax=Nocardioides immobilis TaxID=2049295 RepID=A0A417XVU7_9ACTN|nr:hypothetical protein [Nocardioides immobilis]RHW24618.1 hypothetical protein D0Z08_23040 [Nocardioides immobilis]